jgi:hypothetical protein
LSGLISAADMSIWLSLALGKTEAGRREITERALPLSRSARNLLLCLDLSRSAAEWLELVRGSGPDELQQLLAAGLIGRAADPVESSLPASMDSPGPPTVAEAPRASARVSLADALDSLSYQRLYDRLTLEARQQLGLFKGYRMILDIERCGGPPELRALALQFVEQVRLSKGDADARALAQRLADPD